MVENQHMHLEASRDTVVRQYTGVEAGFNFNDA